MRRIIKNYIVQIGYSSVSLLGWCFLLFHLMSNGFTQIQILAYYLVTFVSAALTAYFIKNTKTSKSLFSALLLRSLTFALILVFVTKFQIYVVGILYGIFITLFWVPYKINFYHDSKENMAILSSILCAAYPVLNLFLPTIGGLIIGEFGYLVLFSICILILGLLSLLARKLPSQDIEFNFERARKNTKGIQQLMFVEGLSTTIFMIIVPFITLNFVKKELDYGMFLGLISIFGVIASFIVAKKSDKKNQRVEYIYPVAILMSISLLLASFMHTLVLWTIFIGIATLFRRILNPFYETVMLDHADMKDGMLMREFLINAGRVCGVAFILMCYALFGNFRLPLVFVSLAALSYPFLLSKKKLYNHSIYNYFADQTYNLPRALASAILFTDDIPWKRKKGRLK